MCSFPPSRSGVRTLPSPFFPHGFFLHSGLSPTFPLLGLLFPPALKGPPFKPFREITFGLGPFFFFLISQGPFAGRETTSPIPRDNPQNNSRTSPGNFSDLLWRFCVFLFLHSVLNKAGELLIEPTYFSPHTLVPRPSPFSLGLLPRGPNPWLVPHFFLFLNRAPLARRQKKDHLFFPAAFDLGQCPIFPDE